MHPELTGAAVYDTPGYISDVTVEGIITALPYHLPRVLQPQCTNCIFINSVYQSDSCFQLF